MKRCVECGRDLPEAAVLCVFCKARQQPEDQLMPTPPPISLPRVAQKPPPAEAPRPSVLSARPAAPPSEPSLLLRLSRWNRNERASLTVAAFLLLFAALVDDRAPILFVGAAMLAAAALVPKPPSLRGLLALGGGLIPLARAFGPASVALVLVPGALLVRARIPTAKVARYIAAAGVAAVLAVYFLPHHGVRPAETILASLRGDVDLPNLLRAIYLLLPVPLAAVGLLAVLPQRTSGGCVLWSTLAVLWLPLGIFLAGLWQGSALQGIAGAAMALACSSGGALGLADLAGSERLFRSVGTREVAS